METIKRSEAERLIKESNGKIMTVVFVKKDGAVRVLNCRRAVSKGVKGVGMSYNPEDFNLLPVYDMQNHGFRMINIDTVKEVRSQGKIFKIR